jgi:hypothetical protein
VSTEGMATTIPEWVPVGARLAAQMIIRIFGDQHPMVVPVLERLLRDARMQAVWAELGKRKRDSNYEATKEPFRTARLPPEIESWSTLGKAWENWAGEFQALGNDREALNYRFTAGMALQLDEIRPSKPQLRERQDDLSVGLVLALAVACFVNGARTVSRKEVSTLLSTMRSLGKHSLADAFEEQASLPENARLTVQRHRTDPRLEAFIETMGGALKAHYGDPLYGTISTIANVAFECSDLNRERVRAVLRAKNP